MKRILKVVSAEVVGAYSLLVTFNDGVTKQVNVRPLLWGPVFEPLLDPARFAEMRVGSDVRRDDLAGRRGPGARGALRAAGRAPGRGLITR